MRKRSASLVSACLAVFLAAASSVADGQPVEVVRPGEPSQNRPAVDIRTPSVQTKTRTHAVLSHIDLSGSEVVYSKLARPDSGNESAWHRATALGGVLAAQPFPSPGIPVGLWSVGRDRMGSVAEVIALTGVHSSLGPDEVLSYLAEARRLGVKAMLRLTGGHPHYTNSRGDFDLAMWKARMARYARPSNIAADIQPYINNGTLAVHMILDDIYNFEGKDPTRDDLDEMARFSKTILPGLPCFVRKELSGLPQGGYGYKHLDGAINQWTLRRGDPVAWFDEQAARAAETGMRIINGLNLTTGGAGLSGTSQSCSFADPLWPGTCTMGPDEIRRIGAAALSERREAMPCASFSWRYTANHLSQRGIAEALSDLVAMGSRVNGESCLR